MGRVVRALGLARSLATYHAIPFRQRRLRRLYRTFVGPGDLVFDVGAHAGNRVRALAAIGCRVVAVEPQPAFAALLRRLFGRTPRVEIVEAAVSDHVGTARLEVSDRTPTVSTLAPSWRAARSQDADFAGVRWNRAIDVPTTTLDALIARFGVPALVKIDVEGGEPAVLRGLSQGVAAVSFEYLAGALDEVEACLHRLQALGRYEFNWAAGESSRLSSPRWLADREVVPALRASRGPAHGDVYARSVAPSASVTTTGPAA